MGSGLITIGDMVAAYSFFRWRRRSMSSKRFLNVNCPGCGLTRAFERITHGLFAEAWDFNKLSFLLYPLAIIIWLHVLGLIMGKQWMWFLRRWY